MDFDFSDEHKQIASEAKRFLEAENTVQRHRKSA